MIFPFQCPHFGDFPADDTRAGPFFGQLGLGTMPRRIDVSLLAIHRVVPAATRHGGVAPRRHVELTENAEGVLV